ncbi:MAG: DUF4255 domain-containing protein, partial [Planctomycetaceae bacterium]
MINDVMIFLKDHLSAHLPDSSSAVPKVVFVQRSGAAETIGFSAETIVPLLINVEEDKAWQTPDRYSRLGADGRREKIHPDLCLGLSVLFVAHFSVYETALEYLSLTVRHFQQFRAFESGGSLPALPAGI